MSVLPEGFSPIPSLRYSSYRACLAGSLGKGLKPLLPVTRVGDQLLPAVLVRLAGILDCPLELLVLAKRPKPSLELEEELLGKGLALLKDLSLCDLTDSNRALSSLETNSNTDFLGVGRGVSPSICPLSGAERGSSGVLLGFDATSLVVGSSNL